MLKDGPSRGRRAILGASRRPMLTSIQWQWPCVMIKHDFDCTAHTPYTTIIYQTISWNCTDGSYNTQLRAGSNSTEILINRLYHKMEILVAYSFRSLMLLFDVNFYPSAVRRTRDSQH